MLFGITLPGTSYSFTRRKALPKNRINFEERKTNAD